MMMTPEKLEVAEKGRCWRGSLVKEVGKVGELEEMTAVAVVVVVGTGRASMVEE